MSQRTGTHFQTGNVRVGQALERRAVGEIALKVGVGQPAQFTHTGILSHDAVPLT